NIIGLVNTNGWRVAHYKYDPYGNLLVESGPLAGANKYRFSSKEWDSQAGLYYYLYRFYDPNLQRWLNRDPLQELGGLDLYGFVANNPINFYDPYGLAIGDWWDARTWFNSGFTESWSDSANSIGQALGSSLAWGYDSATGNSDLANGDFNSLADAYNNGVLGQTKCGPGWAKYGTRGAIGVATAATAAAVTLDAAGISSRIALHGSHHEFGELGRLPHVQLNWWRAGVKGSGGVLRLPVPPGTPGFPP
ncbi:MAG TPA: RHS repeat-associated core domain-containing protein, partial [Verrucomicrobiae bacterium]|nr:RHS repeat-associated core domain-containing protein [Verrucomicrobiae bacterium]